MGGAAAGLALASCIPMVAMLPGAVAVLLSTFGIHTTSGLFAPVVRVLAPFARPLLIVATLALLVGALRCGLRVAVLAAIGGTLLYLSMYVLPGGDGMAGMPGMATVGGTAGRAGAMGPTNAPIFYVGLAAFIGTLGWSAVRRRRRACRPVSLRPT